VVTDGPFQEFKEWIAHYRAAAARTTSLPERHHLARQAARLRAEQDRQDL